MKVFKAIIFGILSLVGTVILILGSLSLILAIQSKLFLPHEYIMSVFKYPISNLLFVYIMLGFYYITDKLFHILNKDSKKNSNSKRFFPNNNKKPFLTTFVILNIVLIYAILVNVTVITNNKIIDHTFLSPQGIEYGFNDIIKIDTGVYGKTKHSVFPHYSKGDFYYIIQLNNGTKINLIDEFPVTNFDDPAYHLYSSIEKLDTQYINMVIPKISSMDNFKYCTQNLDKIYTQKIQNILLNVKR